VDVTRLSRWGLLALLLCIPSLADAQSVVRLHALHDRTTFDGDGDTVSVDTRGHYGTAVLDIAGAIGGGSTITLSCLGDHGGSTWSARPLNGPFPATTVDTDGAVTVTGQYTADIAGCQKVRAVASAWGTGSPTVTLTASTAGGGAGGSSSGSVTADTELPAAGALADDTANPTVPAVAAHLMVWDGSTWDRAQSTRDPCDGAAKTFIPISIVTAATTEITPSLAGASTHYYICSVALVTAGANNVLIADDDSDGCGSPSNGIFGSDATPASGEGWNFAANGGITLGNGNGTVGKTQGTNRVICIITSAAVQLSGGITVAAAQ
jgi:hypothetical protein